MKTYSLILFSVFIGINVFAYAQKRSVSKVKANDFTVIGHQIVAGLRLDEGDAAQQDKNIVWLQRLLQNDGSFRNIDYNSKRRANWPVSAHLFHVQSFAVAYTNPSSEYFKDKALYGNIINSLEYWNKKNPICPNWYSNEIRCPQILGQILLILQDGNIAIPSSLKDSLLIKMQRGNMYKQAGANKIDVALHYLYQAVITKNKPLLDSAVEQCFEPISFTTQEGLQYDYTFLQHGPQLQIAAYGMTFMNCEFKIAAFLRNTKWSIPPDKKKMLVYYFNRVFLQTLRAGYSDFSTTGRGFSRKGDVFKNLSLASGLLHNVALVCPEDNLLYHEVEQRIKNKKPASFDIKALHQQFWKGDYTLQVRQDYLFSVRSNSVRTNRTETGNSENLLGRTMSDGATDIQRRGNEYYGIFPLWEYDKIPGVTSRDYTSDIPAKTQWGHLGTTKFVGGVSDSLYGANVYQQNFDGVKADKSYFFFDKEIVCLGAGIYSDAEEPITTTINQCWLNSKVFSSNNGLVKTDTNFYFGPQRDNWLWQDSIGYFFPEGGNIRVTQDFEKNNWGRINGMYNEKDTLSGYIFKTWFNHGKDPKDAHYAYIVVPGVNEKEMKNYPISDIEILANNDSLQATYHTKLKMLQAVFYRNGALSYDKNKISVSKPCVLMLKPTGKGSWVLSVADPTQLEKNVEIEINGKRLNCQFPSGNNAGRTVELNL